MEISLFGFICLHAALCVHVCHLGLMSLIPPSVDEQPSTSPEVAQPVAGVSMSCDDGESDSLIPPSVDEQPSTSPEPQPLPFPAALGLCTFYGTRKSSLLNLSLLQCVHMQHDCLGNHRDIMTDIDHCDSD